MEERPTPPGSEPEATPSVPQSTPEAGSESQPTPPPGAASPADTTPADALNERGKAVAVALQQVASPYIVQSGGSDDMPWVELQPEHIVAVAQRCKEDSQLQMEMLHCLLAVDYESSIQVVYILFSLALNQKAMLKMSLDAENPRIASVTSLWEAASWYERETHDLFGVEFEGNPNLKPLLLYEGFEGFPGRKSFPLHDYKEY